MKLNLTKVLLLLYLCQSPILGMGQIKFKKSHSSTRVAANSIIKCEALAKLDPTPQKDTLWCYAAATQMILKYYNKNPHNQCDIVNSLNGTTYACIDSCFVNKNRPISMALPCSKYGNLVKYFQERDLQETKILDLKQHIGTIKRQLDSCNPVIAILNSGQSANDSCGVQHVVVINGYFVERRTKRLYFLILDPLGICNGCKYFIEYDNKIKDFKSAKGNISFASKSAKIITFK